MAKLIEVEKIIIPHNWVLIKPDLNFDTYQFSGRETNIHVAPWGINQASHISVTGTVYRCPQDLIYHGAVVKDMRRRLEPDGEPNKDLPRLREQSMSYDVPIELREGDKVYYEYTTRLSAMKEGRIIDTTEGEMMFVPYDILIMAFQRGINLQGTILPNMVRMLNGWMLIKPLEYARERSLQGVVGVKTEWDMFMPVTEENKYVQYGKVWYANVLVAGCLVRDYIDFDKAFGDVDTMGRTGQKIMYDSRQHKRLEVEHHRVIFKNHTLYRIQRKDILLAY